MVIPRVMQELIAAPESGDLPTITDSIATYITDGKHLQYTWYDMRDKVHVYAWLT